MSDTANWDMILVRLFGSSGGPFQNALPVYGSRKAPRGSHYPIKRGETKKYHVDVDGWLHLANGLYAGVVFDHDINDFVKNDDGYSQLYHYRPETEDFSTWVTRRDGRELYPWVEATHLEIIDEVIEPEPPEIVKWNWDGNYEIGVNGIRFEGLKPVLTVHLRRLPDEGSGSSGI
jgi:hypothetical protein